MRSAVRIRPAAPKRKPPGRVVFCFGKLRCGVEVYPRRGKSAQQLQNGNHPAGWFFVLASCVAESKFIPVGGNPPSSSNIFRLNRNVLADFVMFLQLFACYCNLEKRPRYQKTAFYQLTDQLFSRWKARYPLRHKGLRVFTFPTFYQLAVYIRWIAAAACSEVLRPLT